MRIAVCVKEVPDIEGRIVVEKGTVSIRALVPNYIISSLDLLAIEEAIRIKESAGEGHITLVSLGGESVEDILRKGLAMGADEAILLCDPAFDNGDSYTNALALARTIGSLPYDLVLCGQKADDTQAGLVGSYIAGILGIPLVRGVVKIDIDNKVNRLLVQRKLEKGDREVVECSLPALLTVEAGLNNPRNPTIKGVLKARSKEITRYDAKQAGLSAEEVGSVGAKVKMTGLTPPKPKMKGLFVPDSKLSSVEKLRLIMEGGIIQKKSNLLEGEPREIASQLVEFFKQQKIISEQVKPSPNDE